MPNSARSARTPLALLLAFSSLALAPGAAAARPPEPSANISASCVNDLSSGDNYSQYVNVDVDASHKGRWVAFRVIVTVPGASNSPSWRNVVRHDSKISWPLLAADGRFAFLTYGGQATGATVEVQVLDNKGRVVASADPWSGSCAMDYSG